MVADLLVSLGKIAGLGGLCLGIFYILFKNISLPKATRKHLTLFMWLVWSFCIFGITAHVINDYLNKKNIDPLLATPKTFEIELSCGAAPPGHGSSLSELVEYAKDNEGEIVNATVTSVSCTCPNRKIVTHPIYDLQAKCERNPHWWGSKLDLNCVQSFYLTDSSSAGTSTFCFPKADNLPLVKGYKKTVRAVEESISGKFLVYYEFGFGGDHVQLVIPNSRNMELDI